MYTILLAIHSLWRWFVQISLLYAIYRGYRGWLGARAYTPLDNSIRHNTATIAHVQLLLGIWLYVVSPLTSYFMQHYSEALHDREMRFFGMEHITMMLLAVILITIGSIVAKRATADVQKFRRMALWYTVALLVILSSVPWPFSPLVSRPWIRAFW